MLPHPSFTFHYDTISFILDINECSNNNGGCDQICINKNGFHVCSCNESFVLANDGRTCAGKCE